MRRSSWGRLGVFLVRSILVPIVLSWGGCGNSVAPADHGHAAGPATITITPDGGTVTAYSSEGASFTLTFPPDAVRTPIEVTVHPLPPTGSLYALAALEPAGLVFGQPVDVVVSPPDGTDLTDAQLMLSPDDRPMFLPTGADAGTGARSTRIRFFGVLDDSQVVASSPALAAQTAVQSGGGNNLGAGPVDCGTIVASTQQAIDGLTSLGTTTSLRHALTLALNTAALLQQDNCSQWRGFASQVGDLACQGLEKAISDAAASNTSTFGEFYAQAQPLVEWAATVHEYNLGCTADYQGALSGEITDFYLFFTGKLGALAVDNGAFLDLKGEAQTVFRLITLCQALGLPDAETLLRDQAFNPTLDQMRKVAYQLCVADKWHYPLSRLTSTGFFSARDIVGMPSPRPGSLISGPAPSQYANFSDDDIYSDLEYCATCMELDALAAGGGDLDSTQAGGEGAPGQKTDQVQIVTPTRGTLTLSGAIPGFTCWDGTAADQEVVIALGGTDILTLRRQLGNDDYVAGNPARIDILAAAQAAGITPSEGSTTRLTVRRRVTDCDYRLWTGAQDAEYTLLTATLQWKNPTLAVDVVYPDSVDEGDVNTATVTVNVVDQFGVTSPAQDADVTLSVTGGTAQQTSGRTDVDGHFATPITATGAAAVMSDAPTIADGSLTITADATIPEGVSQGATHTASVRICGAQEGNLRQGGTGTYTHDTTYGHGKGYATAGPGQYSYASTEFLDHFVVHVDDPALDGQRGYVYIKVHYHMASSGYSDSRPAARIVIGPRNGYNSPYFWETDLNTPASGDADMESDWEIPVTCQFNRDDAPLDVNADAFAKATDALCTVTAEVTWMGVTKVTTLDGTPVSSYWICSGSGTDYTQPQ